MIEIKSEREIGWMRQAGQIVAQVLLEIETKIRPGITTGELDREAERIIRRLGGEPAFKGYCGFPASICTSVNEEVVHGIPGKRVLKEGDIIGIDVGAKVSGYFGDGAMTFGVGTISEGARRLIQVTREALARGIQQGVMGGRLSNISFAIQSYVESFGYSVVRDFVGHGIGSQMHQDPQVPNFGSPNHGVELKEGMALAIEPMVNQGGSDVVVLNDGWTVVTKDQKLSCHFEHTIVIHEGPPEILTEWRPKKSP